MLVSRRMVVDVSGNVCIVLANTMHIMVNVKVMTCQSHVKVVRALSHVDISNDLDIIN